MRALVLVALVACTPDGDGLGSDAGVMTSVPDGTRLDASQSLPVTDADTSVTPPPLVDASPSAACDTVTSDRTVVHGDVITTCLGNDADVDTYRFTAPATDRAGGTLRFHVDYDAADCQINFKAWIDADAQYTWASANQLYSNPTAAQLDHYFIGLVYPGRSYTLRVMKRLSFSGSCDYTLRTSYVALDDPYEPNQVLADFKPISVGQPVSTYMACVSADRYIGVSDCEDHYTVDLPIGTYQLSWGMTSGPAINPCLSVYCRDTSVSPAVVTHDSFNCQPQNWQWSFSSLFNVTRPSQCYVHLHGSTAGGMYGAYTNPTLPPAMRGTTQRYNLTVVRQM